MCVLHSIDHSTLYFFFQLILLLFFNFLAIIVTLAEQRITSPLALDVNKNHIGRRDANDALIKADRVDRVE